MLICAIHANTGLCMCVSVCVYACMCVLYVVSSQLKLPELGL